MIPAYIKSILVGFGCGLCLLAGSATAASVYFDSTSIGASVGDTVTMELWGDFSDEPTLGGGLDIFYDDTVLDFLSWDTSGSGFFLDPAFSRNPDELAGELEGFAFGNFGGLSGIAKIGSLTFEAIGAGDFIMSMAVTDDPLKGGDFVSAMTYGVQTITFGSSDISVSAVPVPAAIWLFGSGLIGLAGIMRRRNG